MEEKTLDNFKNYRAYCYYKNAMENLTENGSSNFINLLVSEQERLSNNMLVAMDYVKNSVQDALSMKVIIREDRDKEYAWFVNPERFSKDAQREYIKSCKNYKEAEAKYIVFHNFVTANNTLKDCPYPEVNSQAYPIDDYLGTEFHYDNSEVDENGNVLSSSIQIGDNYYQDYRTAKDTMSFSHYQELYERYLESEGRNAVYDEFSDSKNHSASLVNTDLTQTLKNSYSAVSLSLPNPNELISSIKNQNCVDYFSVYSEQTNTEEASMN